MIDQLTSVYRPKRNALFLGLCFPQAWMFVVSQRVVFDTLAFQLAFHLGMLAALLAIALLFRPGAERDPHVLFHPLSAIALCVTPLLGIASVTQPVFAQVAAGAISGLGIAFCFSSWFLIYSSMKTKDACGFILLGFSFGALICLVMSIFSLTGTAPVLAVACVLPFGSIICARRAWDGTSNLLVNRPGTTTLRKQPRRSSSLFLVVQVIVYAVIFGNGIIFSILQGAIPSSSHEHAIAFANYALRALLPFLLFMWLVAREDNARAKALANSMLLALTFLLLMLWFVADASSAIAYISLSLARNLVLVLLYLVLIKLAQRNAQHPCFVFGIGRGLYEASVAGGIAAYSALVSAYGTLPIEEHIVQATAICVFVFLASCFFMTAQNLHDEQPVPSYPVDDPDKGWGQVKHEFSLSDRESEIMQLLYRGHTKKGIADILILSENTVRWYTKQLYAKLDVHSREELIRLVNERR